MFLASIFFCFTEYFIYIFDCYYKNFTDSMTVSKVDNIPGDYSEYLTKKKRFLKHYLLYLEVK